MDARFIGGNKYWIILVLAHHMSRDDAGLRRALRRFDAMGPDRFTVGASAYAAGALGDAAALQRAADRMIGIAATGGDGEYSFIMLGLDELRAHGKAAEARDLAVRLAARMAARASAGPAGDTTRWVRAELLYRAERFAEARVVVDSILPRHARQWLIVGLDGRIAARTGDAARARAVMALLATPDFPAPGASALYERAQIAALLGEPETAVRLLQDGLTRGLGYVFEQDLSFLGHTDMDLESIRRHPTMLSLLEPKG